MDIIVEIQGFRDENNKFLPKEVAVTGVDSEWIGHWIVAPPHGFGRLPHETRRQNNWLSQYFHGIEWYEGGTPIKEVERSLRNICRGERYQVYTRGHEKSKYLENILSRQITNLEECTRCPAFRDSPCEVASCHLHGTTRKRNFSCALQRAMSLREWMRKDKEQEQELVISSLDIANTPRDKHFHDTESSENLSVGAEDEYAGVNTRSNSPFGFYEDRSVRFGYDS